MSTFESIQYSKEGPLAFINLNRPKHMNAYNTVMRDDLYQVIQAVNDDPDVKVAVLSSIGPNFCIGADLTEFGSVPSIATSRSVRYERNLWKRFTETRKPLISSIKGYCLGTGLEIALLCDLRFATETAIFGMPELNLGLIPAAGGTQSVPRATGITQGVQILFSNQTINAKTAFECGLLTRITKETQLDKLVKTEALKLASLDQVVVYAAKEALSKGSDMTAIQGLDLEARLAEKIIRNKL